MKRQNIFAAVFCWIFTQTLLAESGPWSAELAPFAGSGTTTGQGAIRLAGGVLGSVGRQWTVAPNLTLGPRLSLENAVIQSRFSGPERRSISTFDHQLIGLGGYLTKNFGPMNPRMFLGATYGVGKSKLTVDETSGSSYLEYDHSSMPMTFSSAEVGSDFKVGSGDSTVSISLLGNVYRVDQSGATARRSGEERTERGITLRDDTVTAKEENLLSSVTHRILAIKIGLGMGF